MIRNSKDQKEKFKLLLDNLRDKVNKEFNINISIKEIKSILFLQSLFFANKFVNMEPFQIPGMGVFRSKKYLFNANYSKKKCNKRDNTIEHEKIKNKVKPIKQNIVVVKGIIKAYPIENQP